MLICLHIDADLVIQIVTYTFKLARQDYFTHFGPTHSVDGAKTGNSREKK